MSFAYWLNQNHFGIIDQNYCVSHGIVYLISEVKKLYEMDKKELCERFTKILNDWRISHEVFNNGFHIQIQKIHNFYPTKQSYYNSETGEKLHYPQWKNVNDFNQWLSERSEELPEQEFMTVKGIIKVLKECEHLDDAIQFFESKLNA